jgi:glycosyltransferase involved in cell wall biosynthesis
MAGLIEAEDLGVVVPTAAPADLVGGIRAALDRMAADPAWRTRIRAKARDHYTWPVAETAYLKLLRSLESGVVS